MKSTWDRAIVLLALGSFAVPQSMAQTTATRMTSTTSMGPSGIIHHHIVRSTPGDPLGTNAPKLGLFSPTTQAETYPVTWVQTGPGATPTLSAAKWLQLAVNNNFITNDEVSVAKNGTQILVAGFKTTYYSADTGATWTDSPTVNTPYGPALFRFSDGSVYTSPNGNHPNLFYAVSLAIDANYNSTGILIRQSTGVVNGKLTWPAYTLNKTSNSIYIASANADYPQVVVDNSERIWVTWLQNTTPGVYPGTYLNWYVVVNHTTDGNFNLIDPGNGTSWLPTDGSTQAYVIDRLVYDADPAYNAVYAVGSQWIKPYANNACNVFVTRLDILNPQNTWPRATVNTNGPIVYLNTNTNVNPNTSYLPGMRVPNDYLRTAGAVFKGVVYVAWYESDTPSVAGFPTRIELQREIDAGTYFFEDELWTFYGTSYPDPNSIGPWNCPCRLDVCVGNTGPNTIGIAFYGAYLTDAQGTEGYVSRRILTSTDSGQTTWYDSRLSTGQYNSYWTWVSNGFDGEDHLDWYKIRFDTTDQRVYATWDQDSATTSGGLSYNAQTFFNAITP